MKKEEQDQAVNLRQTNGLSIKKIAKQLGVSQSSVSVWVRNVKLTNTQKDALLIKNPSNRRKWSEDWSNKFREKRIYSQNLGARIAETEDKLYAFGCALYWAEGSKSKNSVTLTNSDSNMMKFFVNFLRIKFGVSDEEFKISINCYLNDGLTMEEIQNFWLNLLKLPKECMRICTVRNKYYDNNRPQKYPYGICRVRVHNTDIIQKIYGSIKKYAGINDDKLWVF